MIAIRYIEYIEYYYNSFEEILKLDNYNDITYMDCSNMSLSSLPELPNSLEELWCNKNILSSLPELPNTLIYLVCSDNKISSLPELPNSLTRILYIRTPIYTHIGTHFNGDANKYFEHQKKIENIFANKIGDWFLDCKYNPKYLYCRKRLMKEYEELYG